MIPAELIAALEAYIGEDFVLGSGPGGQNVNKVASNVLLRLNPEAQGLFSERVWAEVKKLAGRRMNKDGALLIQAGRFRGQEKNRADARARLYALIETAQLPPPPPRKATKPTKASITRRIDNKRKSGQTKALRRAPMID